jgi:bifunctional UDP-N-acetylglucosamine pyrophosphorylase/glucosamine-1-phosphate N-acetyltransferase
MKSKDRNKVSLEVNGKPLLSRTINILKSAGVSTIVVVVGFAKESVVNILDKDIIVAEQTKRLGTGHAVRAAMSKIPVNSDSVLILYGDDTFMHSPETFRELYKTHIRENATITFITMDCENPTGYGRIIRNNNNDVVGIVEEKNATEEQKKIKEINLGCYLIDKKYLEKNIRHIKKNPVSKEYYITDIIDIIAKNKDKISAYKLTNGRWRGVNTREDLQEAESLLINEV